MLALNVDNDTLIGIVLVLGIIALLLFIFGRGWWRR